MHISPELVSLKRI